MKAVLLERFGGPERLRYALDAPDPKPAPGWALVRVRACALNHLDLWVREGLPAYKVPLPHILGSDIAGVAVGDSDGARAGQRVLAAPGHGCLRCEPCLAGRENLCADYGILGANGGAGGYAELAAVPQRCLFPVPAGLADESAAAFPLTYLTAWHMLVTLGDLTAGQSVLVLGAGSGVGVAAMQIAALTGARVIAASTSEAKLSAAKAQGAHEGVHLAPGADMHRKVRALTGGRGVDLVFEHVGPAVFDQAVRCLKPGGTLVTCGATTGPKAELDLRYVFSRELSIRGARMGTPADFRRVLALLESGKLKPVVDRVFPLAEARQAHEYLASGKHFGKVVLKIE